jgi:hypothetical protein
LIKYLDALEVRHREGETDDSFLLSHDKDQVLKCAADLLDEHGDNPEVLAYLAYVAHQQRSNVFDEWPPMIKAASTTPAE